jgi:proteasome lid subunit RPN8/RPN11
VPGGPILITRDALRAIDAHVTASPGEGRLGYLVGERFRCTESKEPYVVVSSVIPVTRPLVADKSPQLVGDTVEQVRAEVAHTGRYLIGWYHSHPYGQPTLTRADLETHARHFADEAAVAVVVTVGRGAPQGAVVRPGGERWRHAPAVPFYELVESESLLFGGDGKPSVQRWSNYITEEKVREERPSRISNALGWTPGVPGKATEVIPPGSFAEPPGRSRRRVVGRWFRPALLAAVGAVSIFALIMAIQFAEQGRQAELRSRTSAARPMRSPAAAALAVSADSLARAVRGYRDLATLFDGGRAGCQQLGLGLVSVEDGWITYTIRWQGLAATSTGAAASRQEILESEVQWVEQHFGGSRCARP